MLLIRTKNSQNLDFFFVTIVAVCCSHIWRGVELLQTPWHIRDSVDLTEKTTRKSQKARRRSRRGRRRDKIQKNTEVDLPAKGNKDFLPVSLFFLLFFRLSFSKRTDEWWTFEIGYNSKMHRIAIKPTGIIATLISCKYTCIFNQVWLIYWGRA